MHKLNQWELKPKPDFEPILPVAVTDVDKDGRDVAGTSVEAHVKLTKTICE